MLKPYQFLSGLVSVTALLWTQGAHAQIIGTINAPGVQTSSVTGITTENFNEFSTGVYTTLNSVLGVFTSPGMEISAANQFGGAGGTGNYFAVGAESGYLTATLKLSSNEGYFGFWFSAGDSENQIQLYENSTLEYTLNTAGLISFINQQSNASSYYGNPNSNFSGQDSGEPFAYVNFFGTNGTVFNTIVFSNTSTGTGFEMDNESIATSASVSGQQFTPEPSAWVLALTGGLTGAAFRHRKRATPLSHRFRG